MLKAILLVASFVFVGKCQSCRDGFGVKQIFETDPGGFNFESKFQQSRSFPSTRIDPGDSRCWGRGSGTYSMANGVMTMSGRVPRYYCYLDNENIEMTVYWKRGTEFENKFYNGLTMIARSRHQNYGANPCDAASYYLRLFASDLRYRGQLCVTKEFAHKGSTVYSSHVGCVRVFPGAIPQNVWIGVKFVVRTVSNGVNLRGYVDTTSGGAAGAAWTLKVDFTDTGSNMRAQPYDSVGTGLMSTCRYPYDYIIRRPGQVFFLRADRATNYQYKMFSARSINPQKMCGGASVTTTTASPSNTRITVFGGANTKSIRASVLYQGIAPTSVWMKSRASSTYFYGRKQSDGSFVFPGSFALPVSVIWRVSGYFVACDVVKSFPSATTAIFSPSVKTGYVCTGAYGGAGQNSKPTVPAENKASESSSSSSNRNKTIWIIVGGAVSGCILIVCLVLLIRHFCCVKKMDKQVPLAQQGNYRPPDFETVPVGTAV